MWSVANAFNLYNNNIKTTPIKLLDGVYMNGIHALRRLDLRNTSGERLRIRLQSNLGAQIAFQLSNENLPEERAHEAAETVATGTDDTASGIAAMTTTLASAASGPTAEGSRVMTTSQSLASLASLDSEPSVTSGGPTALAPSLFLHRRAVATNTAHAAALNLAMRASARTADTATTSAYHQCNELFNYVNYIDSVDLEKAETKSIVLAFLPEPKQVNSNNAEAMSPSTADASYEMSEYNGTLSFLVTRIDRDGVERDTRRGGDAADLPRPTTYTIKFRSKVCRSVLASSVAETGIAFDDCVAGVAYHKDFTVWNRSEIDLYFTVAITGLADTAHENWFTITDYDSGERIDMKAVPAFSYRRIRMTLLASEPADIGAELIIENINDLNNVETVPLQAVVRSVLHEESLVVTSGHVVDFGDCYTGSWSRQPITIKNIANVPLEVSFHAEHIPGTVSFDLRSDDVKENAGEPGVTTSAPTVTSALSDRAPTRASGRTSAGDSVWVDATAALVRSTAVSVSSSRNSSPSRGERAPSGGDSRSASSLDFLDEMQIGRADSRSSLMRLTGTGTGGGRESTNPYETSQSRSRRSGDNSGTQIEELLLPPGTERTITICFRMDGKERISGTLEKVSFKVSLAYAPLADMPVTKQYKRIACRARVCTSLISITPNELNFGDVDVGTLKSLPVRITNLADLTANVELRYDSKILNCSRGEISIAPRQSQEVKIDIYPRKVNPE